LFRGTDSLKQANNQNSITTCLTENRLPWTRTPAEPEPEAARNRDQTQRPVEGQTDSYHQSTHKQQQAEADTSNTKTSLQEANQQLLPEQPQTTTETRQKPETSSYY
jgi:hypothetical protein